ncbi:MAG: hypothetical protein RLZZ337_1701 [Bacteroidota bacterium]|jgi:opacity protein-like surface antigen
MHISRFIVFAFISTLASIAMAQEPIRKGTIGIGLNAACPQSELKDVKYDDGVEMNLSFLSRRFPYKSEINMQVGARMDFGGMGKENFKVSLATPVPDAGNYEVSNRTYALMAVGRINFGYDQKVAPFVDLLFGHRNYSTNTYLTANNPDKNPDYESTTFQGRVVYTKRMHYGAGVGVNYKLNDNISLQSSVAYTFGNAGAVMPLQDVTQSANGEVNFPYQENIKTDILLINLGFEFQLWKKYRTTSPSTQPNNSPTNTRYKDTQPTQPKTSDPVIKDRPKSEPPAPKKKAPLKIKTEGPKDGDVGN